MDRVVAPAWAVALILVTAWRAWAVVENPVEVSQPSGDEIITTTYFNWEQVGYPVEVALTAVPNTVTCFGKPENRNEASKRGIRVVLVPGPGHLDVNAYDEMRGLGMRGDTVDVVLELTNAAPMAAGPSDSLLSALAMQMDFDHLVEQTFSCILLNARRRWPELRFVSLEVRGSGRYPRLNGVHALAAVPQLGGVSQWSAEATRRD